MAAIYAVAAGLWILFSDRILLWYFEDPAQLTDVQTAKGWFFVLATAAMLGWLVRHYTRELNHEKELLNYVISNIPLYVFWKDKEGKYLGCNQRFASVAGVGSKENICGKTDYDLAWPEAEAKIATQTDRQVMETKESHLDVEETHQANGKDAVFLTSRVPLADESGNVMGMLGICADITERKLAEEALRQSESFYRQTLESIPGMVFTTRPDGYCDYQSQQWVDFTGVPMREHLGDGWNKLLHPDDRPRAFAAWRNAVEERAPYDLEYRVRRQDGEYEWFKVCGRPIRNEAGEIVRWFGTALNIDQMVRTQEELRQAKETAEAATRVKGQFLANMSHELRTPMAGVLGMLDLALLGELSTEQRGYLEKVKKSAHALLRILNDILDFSRIEAGMLSYVREPFLLHELVRVVVDQFDQEARSKGLDLVLEIAQGTPKLMEGDEGRVRQILLNLVGNAVKFTEQGQVAVRVAAGASAADGRQEVTFTVADTGIGIPGDNRHAIFRPFSQADASHARRFGGTGLGLAISKEVAERMGGNISFASEPGVGSTFVVTLPLREAEAAAPAPAPAAAAGPVPAPAAAGAARPRLLVAEDDQIIREILGLMLRQSGFDFDCVANGEEAVRRWATGGYDLILMDVQMPLIDGFVATSAIRVQEESRGGHVPIVALTAHVYPTDQQKCLDAGMDAYVAKPIDFQKLLAVIRDLLGRKVKGSGAGMAAVES
ncbi:MAG TPA: PAS domain-containing protein [Desulfuromonadales bacterium]|nr:PAS domain-containing protein [Desulfuromonadales bacterium]